MKEESFSIPAADGAVIYGKVNLAAKKAGKVVVLCHGLTGHIHEQHYQAAKAFFTQRDYDVVRFGFYSGEKGARRMPDCDVAAHVADLNAILAHVAPQYKKVFIAGHSYGGLTILRAAPAMASAVSFWDSNFYAEGEHGFGWNASCTFNRELGEHVMNMGSFQVVIGSKLYNERGFFTRERLNSMAEAFPVPTQVIAAGAFEANLRFQRLLFEKLRVEKDYHAVAGATHCFYEGDTILELLENTHRWFERFQ